MGIGLASGENRAIEAAQQAISSPLLEVAIDGARGILFNVIGGMDMSMHEINTVAETITAAADSEANIIFGASINPDLEGEIIVTVIATGFEESYYASRNARNAELLRNAAAAEASAPEFKQVDDETMRSLDMEIKEPVETGAHDFHGDDTPAVNIWNLAGEDSDAKSSDDEKGTNDEDEEYDKPSFLRRRLKIGRKSDSKDGDRPEHKDSNDILKGD
jgi:cell division protein FtsZ